MAHGGTNFGFYNGANTGVDEADYKPDLTSYDYVRNLLTLMSCVYYKLDWLSHIQDAPIRESGDVDNSKFNGMDLVFSLIFKLSRVC